MTNPVNPKHRRKRRLTTGAYLRHQATTAAKSAEENPGTTVRTVTVPDTPSEVAVLGKLSLLKVRTPSGSVKSVRPKGKLLATDAAGKNMFIVPSPGKWQTINGRSSGAARRAAIFHNVKKVTKFGQVTIPDMPKELHVVGEVIQIEYTPIEPSPKANIRWFHKSGDTGGDGEADSEVILANLKGRSDQMFLIVTKTDRGYPKIGARGIVG